MSTANQISSLQLGAEHLNQVLPGCSLKLEFMGARLPRIQATLVGYEDEKYLIVRLNDPNVWSRYKPFLTPNNKLVARMLVEHNYGECLAFRTFVRWQSHHPLDFLFLDFPERIQKCELREHKRVPTCIKAILHDIQRVFTSSSTVNGCISDVSLGGCKFEFDLPDNRSAVSEKPLTISAGDKFSILADVRNQRRVASRRVAVGLKFQTSVKETKKLLSSLYIAPEMLSVS